MAAAEKIGFREFRERFATEESCRDFLMKQRFPNGFVCPRCGCTEYYPIHKRHICQCKHCRHQTSVTSGTVMHRTHLSLVIWFWAIYLVATDKRGISAVQLAKQLELSYESAWYLLKRIRAAMGQRDQKYLLSGIIEMDDAYFGGEKHGGKRGRGTEQKTAVLAISKTKDGKPLFLQISQTDTLKTADLQAFVDGHIKQDSTIQCDGYASYKNLTNVLCMPKVYDSTSGDLKWMHTVIANLKAFLLGTYHGRCTEWQSYFDEFAFRFNRRHFSMELFPRLARAVATSCALLC